MDIFLISTVVFIGVVAALEYFLFANFQFPRLFHVGIPTLIARFSCQKNFNTREEEKRLNRRFKDGYNMVEFLVQSDTLIIFREVSQYKKINLFYGHMIFDKESLTIDLKLYFSIMSIAIIQFTLCIIKDELFFDVAGLFVLIFALIAIINTTIFYKNIKKLYK